MNFPYNIICLHQGSALQPSLISPKMYHHIPVFPKHITCLCAGSSTLQCLIFPKYILSLYPGLALVQAGLPPIIHHIPVPGNYLYPTAFNGVGSLYLLSPNSALNGISSQFRLMWGGLPILPYWGRLPFHLSDVCTKFVHSALCGVGSQ